MEGDIAHLVTVKEQTQRHVVKHFIQRSHLQSDYDCKIYGNKA
jgi:hypothetical protein